MTINMNLKQGKQRQRKVSQEKRRQLLSDRISDSSPDIIFCQELPWRFDRVATGYDWVSNGNEAAVMWKPKRFEGSVNEVHVARDHGLAIIKARNLLSKISMVKLTNEKSNVRTLAVSYDGRSLRSEKLRHGVFSILVEFLKKVIAEKCIDFCIIGGDIGLDTVELPTGLKILSYESDKENDHRCMDYYILRAGGERGVKCVQNIKAVHFETVVEEYILPFSQSSINDGWSNACTIIAVLAAIDFLSGEEWFSHNSLASRLGPDISTYCHELFKRGNQLYDKLGENKVYSTLDILKHSKLDFKNHAKTKEMYDKTHSNFAGFVENLTGLLSKQVKLAFVLIFAPREGVPVSMVLLINELGESILIDSHTHLKTGAIVATAPENELKNMINYIETMVKRHWGLTVSNDNRFDVTAVELKKKSSESTLESTSELTSKSTTESTSKSTSKSTPKSTSKLTSKSTPESTSKSTSKSTPESTTESTSDLSSD